MIARIDEARSAGDTVGGVFEVVVHGLPIGLGSYVHWDRRLDGALAAAVMSINIVKGVEFGLGFEQTRRFGSAVHDVIEGRGEDGRWVHRTNNAGGLTGGITNGEPLVVRGAVKPISTLARPLPSADLVTGEAVDKAHYERSDISVVPAAGVVAEAMVMLTLARFVLEKFGGDTIDDVKASLEHYRARISTAPEPPVAGGRAHLERRGGRRRDARPDRHRRGRLGRGRLRPIVDVVLIGLPGSGKSVVGRRLAGRHGAAFIDLDERIESGAGRSIPEIFAEDGEAAFRALERAAIADLGPADGATEVRSVIATGGGAVVDPRNRWALFRGRISVWLDGRPEVLAQRLRRSPNVRPLVSGRDPIGTIRDLAARRERFYAAATIHQIGVTEVHGVVDAVDQRVAELLAEGRATSGARTRPTTLLRASTPIGRIVLGEGIAAGAVGSELDALRAPRAILVSEPGAWAAAGERLAAGLRDRGHDVAHILLPQGEAAKRLDVIETAARELAAMRVERGDALVAVGGGALGDAAGFLAAIYLRGIRFIQVPTTLVAQIDSAIGGKTGVDLPEGKNLRRGVPPAGGDRRRRRRSCGRSPSARCGPPSARRSRWRPSATSGCSSCSRPMARRSRGSIRRSSHRASIAEVVERAGWAKVEVVVADERERGCDRRPAHAQPRAFARPRRRGGSRLRRAAPRRGGRLRPARRDPDRRRGRGHPARARRSHRRAARRGWVSRRSRSPTRSPAVMDRLATDKKHAAGRLRWVLPTADGVLVRDDVDPAVVERAAAGAAGRPERERPMTTVLVLQGPNLNLVGTREPEIYGHESLDEIHAGIAARAAELGLVVDFFQSNHEGALIDRLHRRDFDVAIVNAGGLTHTSVALRDALLGVARPFIEVHLSDPARREPFRQVNFLHDVALESIVGQGPRGYHLALESIARRFADGDG